MEDNGDVDFIIDVCKIILIRIRFLSSSPNPRPDQEVQFRSSLKPHDQARFPITQTDLDTNSSDLPLLHNEVMTLMDH